MLLLLLLLLVAFAAGDIGDDPLGSPEGYLKYDIKKGASLQPGYQAVGYWNGSVFGWEEGEDGSVEYTRLFYFEGVNVRSVYQEEDGSYVSLSREVSVYRDLATGDILEAWTSHYLDRDNEVFEVANDPVNALLGPYVGQHSYTQQHTSFTGDFWLDYPNPLPPGDYPAFSSGPQYQGGELFLTFARTENLLDESLTEVGYVGSWARVGPWLPWMEMGDRPGGLIYSAPFLKLSSVSDLPSDLVLWMDANYPEYFHPPANYTIPNMTSWRVFKAIIDTRRAAGEPDIQVPEQGEKGDPRRPHLDPAFLASLQELGKIELSFEGTSYFLVEGETGQDLLWLEGALSLEFVESMNADGDLVLDLSGLYSTPWPERQPVSGGQWTNPEGREVTVPGVVTQASWDVGDSCTSMQAMSDGWNYDILNCEVVLGQDLVLLTLYLGSSPQGSRDLVGGVTHRMGFHSWLDMQAKGYLVNRLLFKFPQLV